MQTSAMLRQTLAVLVSLLVGISIGYYWLANHIPPDRLVGAEEYVSVSEQGLRFLGRVDSGATITSINAQDIEVENTDLDSPRADKGKKIRFTLVNEQGEKQTLDRQIIKVRYVHSSDCGEWRYYVFLDFTFRGKMKQLLVNLNDRSASSQKLLLGRDWLKQGYIVDVGQNGRGDKR